MRTPGELATSELEAENIGNAEDFWQVTGKSSGNKWMIIEKSAGNIGNPLEKLDISAEGQKRKIPVLTG